MADITGLYTYNYDTNKWVESASTKSTDKYADVSSLTSSTASSDTMIENPNGKLDKNAFLKLMLVELQYQDPTSPMDNEKMLAQTAQMTALESQESTTKALTALQESFSTNSQFSAINMINKAVNLGTNQLDIKSGIGKTLYTYLAEPAQKINVAIQNSKGEVVKTFETDTPTEGGLFNLYWDSKNDAGVAVADGKYTVNISYQGQDGSNKTANLAFLVEAVQLSGTQPQLKIGDGYKKMSEIKEIYG
jgi:flagellar basal-body rod modification protein FlgD